MNTTQKNKVRFIVSNHFCKNLGGEDELHELVSELASDPFLGVKDKELEGRLALDLEGLEELLVIGWKKKKVVYGLGLSEYGLEVYLIAVITKKDLSEKRSKKDDGKKELSEKSKEFKKVLLKTGWRVYAIKKVIDFIRYILENLP